MNLYEASNQWANRPDDERCASIAKMRETCHGYFSSAVEGRAAWRALSVVPEADQMTLCGATSHASLTHYAFGQLAQRAGAPAEYLRSLPAELASRALNYGLAEKGDYTQAQILLHQNGGVVARALTSTAYERIWNWEVCDRLGGLVDQGWRVPPARPCRPDQAGARLATEVDLLRDEGFGLSVKIGDPIAPAGLYASDRDMFAFLVNENRVGNSLARGFFVSNSEVGDAALKLTTFLYNHVCGNHIVWDADQVRQTRIIHMGRGARHWRIELRALDAWSEESTEHELERITAAKTHALGASKEEVLDAVFRLRDVGLSRTMIGHGYDTAEAHPDDADGASPRTVWGMVQGLTRYSQTRPHAGDRVSIDRAAGRLLRVAF